MNKIWAHFILVSDRVRLSKGDFHIPSSVRDGCDQTLPISPTMKEEFLF